MVRDGFYYALGLGAVAAVLWYLAMPLALVALPIVLAAFFLWFFRDPNRVIPQEPGQIVSPGDGLVTEAEWIETTSGSRLRLSIFLNVFDVHVNRSPVSGTVKVVEFRAGQFLNAMKPESVLHNEQTLVVIDAGDYDVSFKQIAGLLARRIVCNVKVGDRVERGQRVGLIKFGSRVDVLLPAEAELKSKDGLAGAWRVDRSGGGSSNCGGSNPVRRQWWPDGRRGVRGDAEGRRRKGKTPAQPGNVCAAVAVYRRQYCRGILCDYAEHSGVGDGAVALRPGGAGDRVCHPVRWT